MEKFSINHKELIKGRYGSYKHSSKTRRNAMIELLKRSEVPIKSTQLAEMFDVSRQIISKDIGILRDLGYDIISTTSGYILKGSDAIEFKVKVKNHSSYEDMRDELLTIIESGATVKDVIVEHALYGELVARLNISTREYLDIFLQNAAKEDFKPLSTISSYHYHTIRVSKHEDIDVVMNALKKLNILI